MKVLHVIPSLSPVHGGPTRAIALMERALAGQGVEVETATTDDDGPGRRAAKPCHVPVRENGAVHFYFPRRIEFYKVAPAFAGWMRREVRGYDLVHIHALFSYTTPVAASAARRAGVPYIVRPLGTLNRWGMDQRRPALKKLAMRFLDGPALRGAAAVHFTSEAEAAEARLCGIPLREAIVPLAVESEPLQSDRDSRASELLYLSRLDPKKNLESLLDAMRELPAEVRLTIAGAGDPAYVHALKQRAQALGIAPRVTWLGHVEGQAKAGAFSQAGVFVLPSFSENFGIAAAEALAAGLPCVLGENVAIANNVVRAGAGLAVATDAASIAAGLRLIMRDREGLQAMSRNARRLAHEEFSVQAMGARLKHLYSQILQP